jgi:hypothetical protein
MDSRTYVVLACGRIRFAERWTYDYAAADEYGDDFSDRVRVVDDFDVIEAAPHRCQVYLFGGLIPFPLLFGACLAAEGTVSSGFWLCLLRHFDVGLQCE